MIFHKYISLFANRFLGALMFFYSISLLHLLLEETGYYLTHPHLMFVLLSMIFLIGPLHFLYVKHLIRPSPKFSAKEWLHFLPFVLYLVSLAPDFLTPAEEMRVVAEASANDHIPAQFLWLNWVFAMQLLAYMFVTILWLKRYALDIKDVFSSLDKVRLDWLRNITYMATAVVFIFFSENVLLMNGINLSDFNLSSTLTAVYVYTMGYLGISKSEIFSQPEVARSMEQLPGLGGHDNVQNNERVEEAEKKYQKSGLSAEVAGKHLERLLRLMEEEAPYTDSSLTLLQLSQKMSISPHHLSEVINSRLNQKFFDFINQYRVAKVAQDLSDEKKQHFTLLAIAHDAGFNSKSSFNTIFKKQTGLTPSEYRKELKAKT
ncbi:AraC family transcriptional regulator [Fulvivirga sp. M361]|uniref:helix-turn-helix domain-containing protein n=1 Tax=Fulvivirga sp. M361 TaxID=2594266 RepID=UPI00162497A3|nr:helix-turn-helix domain-containing protein [Fulvivirga sp. M361]